MCTVRRLFLNRHSNFEWEQCSLFTVGDRVIHNPSGGRSINESFTWNYTKCLLDLNCRSGFAAMNQHSAVKKGSILRTFATP